MALETNLIISADVSGAIAGVESLKKQAQSTATQTAAAFDKMTGAAQRFSGAASGSEVQKYQEKIAAALQKAGVAATEFGKETTKAFKDTEGATKRVKTEVEQAYDKLKAVPVAQVKAQIAEIRAAYEQLAASAAKADQGALLTQAARRANTVARRGGLDADSTASALGVSTDSFNKALGGKAPVAPPVAPPVDLTAFQSLQAKLNGIGNTSFGKLTGSFFAAQLSVEALIGAVSALNASFEKFVQTQDKFAEIGSKIGVAASAVAEYDFVLKQTDTSLADFALATKKLQQNLIGADEEGSAAANAFRQLGIAVRDSNGELLPTEEIINKIADATSQLKTEAERTAFLTATLGRNGQQLEQFFKQGAAGIAAARAEAQALGAVLSETLIQQVAQLDNELKKLSAAKEGNLARSFGEAVPVITELVKLLTQDLANGGLALGAIFKDVAETVLGTYNGLKQVSDVVKEVGATVGSIATEYRKFLGLVNETGDASVRQNTVLENTAAELRGIVSLFQSIANLVREIGSTLGAKLSDTFKGLADDAANTALSFGFGGAYEKIKQLSGAYDEQSKKLRGLAASAGTAQTETQKFASAQAKTRQDAINKAQNDFPNKEQGSRTFKTFTGAKDGKEGADKTDAIAKAQLALIRAGLEAELNVTKAYLESATAAYDRAYANGESTLQEYTANRIAVLTVTAEKEKALRESEIKQIEEQAKVLRGKGKLAEALGLDKDAKTLKAKLEIDEEKLRESVRKAQDELSKIKDISIQVRLDFSAVSGQVDIDALRAKLDKELGAKIATLQQAGDFVGAGQLQALNDNSIARAQAQNSLGSVRQALAEIGQQEALINAQRNSGLISESEAQTRVLSLYKEQGQALNAQREIVANLLTQAQESGNKVFADDLKQQLADIDVKRTETFGKLNADARAFNQSFAGAFSNAFSEAITASASLGDALKKNLLDVLNTALNKLLNEFFNELISGLAKSAAGNSGGFAGLIKAGASLFGFADGGFVGGYSPNPRADNIPARLTAGEFVMKVPSVQKYGTGFMNAVNTGTLSKDAALAYLGNAQRRIDTARASNRNYADGGFVAPDVARAVSQMPVVINITNNGQAVGASSSNSQFDGKSLIVNVILDELRRGGAVSNAINNSVRR